MNSQSNIVVMPSIRASRKVTSLSPREDEVVGLLADGLSAKQIAHLMGISIFTVRAFVRTAKMRLNADSTAQLAAMWAAENTQRAA